MNIPKLGQFQCNDITGDWSEIERLPKKYKPCEREGCGNLILDRENRHFCTDTTCITFRKEEIKTQKRKDYEDDRVYPETINLRVPKRPNLIGKTLNLRCSAKSPTGRCCNNIVVPYSLNRRVYPKFCPEHTNEWRRVLFQLGRI